MKIITSVVNNPTFIEIQLHTFKKYLKSPEDYEFIVFNDAKEFPDQTNGGDITIKSQIKDLCDKLHIQCINIPNNHHQRLQMGSRHQDVFNNYIIRFQLENPDKYLLIDSDMFLVSDFDISKYMKYSCAVVLQSRVGKVNTFLSGYVPKEHKYIWPGLCYLDITQIKNPELLNWSGITGICDTGGMMNEWLLVQTSGEEIPDCDDIRWNKIDYQGINETYYIRHLWSCSWGDEEIPLSISQELKDFIKKDPRNLSGKYYCELYDDVFLHYRAGSNWNNEGMEIHKNLSLELKRILFL